MDWVQITISMLGGLGLFLFGMKIMSSGLVTIAGDRMQSILQHATSNRFLGVLVGILATIALNSSTATTIMTVSFVNSGMMNLTQSIGIIMGANVGTTFSSQLVAFRVDAFAPVFIFIGAIMYLFVKKRSVKNIGYIILGFGILFFGITVLGGPLRGLADDPAFRAILATFENPFLALLAGFAFTAVVQSSTAATGVLVAFHLAGAPIPLETSAFIILGTNIGTSITTVIASIPANRESKRAALFHIMFDIIGSAIFGTLIFFVPAILSWFQATWSDTARQVAMFHTLYNFATMFLILPFVKHAALLMKKIVPSKANGSGAIYEKKLMYLDPYILSVSPPVASAQARKEVERMANLSLENYRLSIEIFLGRKSKLINDALINEQTINFLNHEITRYLVRIAALKLGYMDNKMIGSLYHVVNDIERIGDHAENIVEFSEAYIENEKIFSEEAITEITNISQNVESLLSHVINVFSAGEYNQVAMDNVHQAEKALDIKIDAYKRAHIKRLEKGYCNPKSGMLYVNMLSDLERIADHATNIAYSLRYQK